MWFLSFVKFKNYLAMTMKFVLQIATIIVLIQAFISISIMYFNGYAIVIKMLYNTYDMFGFWRTFIEYGEVRSAVYKTIKELYEVFKTHFNSLYFLWLILPIWIFIANRKSKNLLKDKYISGTQVMSEKQFAKHTKNAYGKIKINDIKIPQEIECGSFMIVGASGYGKTQLLKQVIGCVKNSYPNSKAVVHDIKGDWTCEYYQPDRGDLLFNPLDRRSICWTIFNDIDDIVDVENFSSWLFPNIPGKDPFWQDSAREIFRACLLKCIQDDKKTNEELRRIVNLNSDNLASELAAVSEKAAQFASKRDCYLTFNVAMGFIRFLVDGTFSVRKWINTGRGFLFLLNHPKYEAIFKPVISLFFNVAASSVLSLKDYPEHKTYFFVDEITSLQKISEFLKFSNLSRSKGVSFWFALQHLAQIVEIYGQSGDTFIENSSNAFCFKINHVRSKDFMSKFMGQQTVIKRNLTTSFGSGTSSSVPRDSISISETEKQEVVVRVSDIDELKTLEAFMRLKDFDITSKIKIEPIKNNEIASTFEQIDLSESNTQDINKIFNDQNELSSLYLDIKGSKLSDFIPLEKTLSLENERDSKPLLNDEIELK